MGLPNATAVLSTLPGGIRAVVSRDSVVASLAVRTAIHDMGQLTADGLDREVKANVWTLCADFSPKVKIGDVLTVDGTLSVVIDASVLVGNLVSRAQVLLFEDTISVSYNGQTTQALVSASSDDESLSDLGERGLSTGRIRVIASLMTKPAKGATMIINGKVCLVGHVSIDPRFGLMSISYQETTEVIIE